MWISKLNICQLGKEKNYLYEACIIYFDKNVFYQSATFFCLKKNGNGITSQSNNDTEFFIGTFKKYAYFYAKIC